MAEFRGSSDNGNFQEALEEAIWVAAGGFPSDAVTWRLKDVYGLYGGFILENSVTVVIDATPPAIRGGGGGAASASDASAPVEVPIFPVGIVQRLEGPDYCMDGARFRLLSVGRRYRLKAANDEAERYLDSVAGTPQLVVVAGYLRYGPECPRLDVYYAGPADSAIEALSGGRQS